MIAIEPRVIKMRLVGFRTKDGYWNVQTERVALGKEYSALPGTRRIQRFYNNEFKVEFECEVINCWCDVNRLYLEMPTELLEEVKT